MLGLLFRTRCFALGLEKKDSLVKFVVSAYPEVQRIPRPFLPPS